jgi:hypothetical protein
MNQKASAPSPLKVAAPRTYLPDSGRVYGARVP